MPDRGDNQLSVPFSLFAGEFYRNIQALVVRNLSLRSTGTDRSAAAVATYHLSS
jgi:hypothetical protein